MRSRRFICRRSLRGQQQRISGCRTVLMDELGNATIGFHIRQRPTQLCTHSRQGIGNDKFLLGLFVDKR
jgi:hypothetical protein